MRLSQSEMYQHILLNRYLAMSHYDGGQKGTPPQLPLPSQADKAAEDMAQEDRTRAENAEWTARLMEMQAAARLDGGTIIPSSEDDKDDQEDQGGQG